MRHTPSHVTPPSPDELFKLVGDIALRFPTKAEGFEAIASALAKQREQSKAAA